jgi:hypothetical protein
MSEHEIDNVMHERDAMRSLLLDEMRIMVQHLEANGGLSDSETLRQLFSILEGAECLKVLGVEQVPAAEPAEIE